MKIALINASPRFKKSVSACVLQDLKCFLKNDDNELCEFNFSKPEKTETEMQQLAQCDALVFALPLYVDAIPSHLINCLAQLEGYFSTKSDKDIFVYCIVNCGFYEGRQNEWAIEIVKNWCAKAELKWGQGVGIGAGGMLTAVKKVPIGRWPKNNLGMAFKELSKNILNKSSGENIFVKANFPRIIYKVLAEKSWRASIKANGLKRKDLFTRK